MWEIMFPENVKQNKHKWRLAVNAWGTETWAQTANVYTSCIVNMSVPIEYPISLSEPWVSLANKTVVTNIG